ncbi:MAG: LAGLIDADG family homing endonuclease [Bacteroidetes bacterium]|nr:LAGLIDADG family homing endonuclease [Bacteroidota bacterium]
MFTLKVGMMKTNARAIYKLKTIMGVGKVHKEDKNGMVVYKLSDRQKIKERLYPLLEAYPFRGEKYYEYEVLKEGMKVCEDETLTMDQKDSIMEKLKEKSNIVKELTPVVCEREEDRIKSIKEVIENLSVEKLKEIYDP